MTEKIRNWPAVEADQVGRFKNENRANAKSEMFIKILADQLMWAEWTLVEWLIEAKAVIDKELVCVCTLQTLMADKTFPPMTNHQCWDGEDTKKRDLQTIFWKRWFKRNLSNCVWKDKERPSADRFLCGSSSERQSDLIHAFARIFLTIVKVLVTSVHVCVCIYTAWNVQTNPDKAKNSWTFGGIHSFATFDSGLRR